MITKDDLVEAILANELNMLGLAYSITKSIHDAEDAVGETIEIAFKFYSSIRKEESICSWLMTVVHNQACSIIRRKKRIALDSDIIEVISSGNKEEQYVENIFLWEQILKLPDEYRKLVCLHYIHGYSVNEISVLQSIPVGTIKSRLSKARKLLKNLICGEDTYVT